MKNNRKTITRKILCLIMAFVCVFSVAAPYSAPVASAQESLEDLRNQIDEIEKDIVEDNKALAEVEKDIKNNEKKLDNLNDQLDKISQQVDLLMESIDIINDDIDDLQGDINVTTNDIKEINTQIAEIEAQITETEALMDSTREILLARIRENYMSGEASTVELLFSSTDLSTFFARQELVKRVSENDAELISELTEKINELAELQSTLETTKSSLEEKKSELNSQMNTLNTRQNELESNKKSQQKKQEEAAEKYSEVENLIEELDKDSDEYKKAIKKKEAEREALEAEIDEIIKQEGSQVGDTPDEEYENDGTLGWPLKERCTITAGYPYYPSGGRHWGIDICLCTSSGSTRDSNGNSLSYGQPYYASQGGEVIIADWHKSFGNYVVVDHGDGKQTLYAHSKSLNVKKGDIVKKGQQLGLMGDTGNVTGPHLHFEVRIKNADGSVSRENPLNYVSKPSYVI
ncbi:MAG: peptidoglycan DD-metalloendopeptidase family protein [Clostridia bacterium]|nr:peptidoglycan DD-metalloendopeptidase family protein [Clostridia bacterium]